MRPEFQNTSSDGTVSYSTDTIRETAGKIMVSAGLALDTHTNTWNIIQNYLDGGNASSYSFSSSSGWVSTMEGRMPDVYALVRTILEPHEKRVRDAFNLQLSIAQALFDLADQIDQTEQAISAGFSGTPAPIPPVRHPGKNA